MLSHLSKQHFWYFNLFSQNCSTNLNSTTNPLHPHNATVYSDSTPASPNPLYTRSHSLLYISIFRIRSIPFPLFFHFNPTCSNLTAVYNDLTILHPLFFFLFHSIQYRLYSHSSQSSSLTPIPPYFYSTLTQHSTPRLPSPVTPLYFVLFNIPFLFFTPISTINILQLYFYSAHTLLLSNSTSLYYHYTLLPHYSHCPPLYYHSSYQLSSTTPLPHHSSWLPLHCTASYLYYDHSTNYITLSTIVSGYFCHFKNIAIPCRLNLSRLYIVNTFRILGNEARHFTLKDDTTANRNAATAPAVVPPTYTTIDGLSFVGK